MLQTAAQPYNPNPASSESPVERIDCIHPVQFLRVPRGAGSNIRPLPGLYDHREAAEEDGVSNDSPRKTREMCPMWRTLFAFTTGDGWGSVDLTCCKDYPTSEGCTKCKAYVCISTKSSDTGCHQLFALDCELVFTTMGLEVARVSLANGSSQDDALVQPEHETIDFNTRFSGVTKQDYVLYKVKTLKEAQYDLLHYIKNGTASRTIFGR
ncbi:hypothetical protein J6590_081602 [Homalodisca vitripennis]|nr:hypothetical protein J6590_081602 [Homalodisca vitripennis]